ncbi:MAG TPA: hypothetical protein VFH29_10245, partial [Anaerolineales bacterium]|nr:hypothetical protein [Anaerolineales bacterium]
ITIGAWKLNWTNDLVPAFDEKSAFTFSAGTKEYLVPVSAAPGWELGGDVHEIRLHLPPEYRGQVQFTALALFRR